MKQKTMTQEHGQALVSLLFFTIIAITITSAAVVVIIVNTLSTTTFQQGNSALYAAEAGIENALLRLLRNTNYSGETMVIGDTTTEITVSGTNPKVITAKAIVGNAVKTIRAETQVNNYAFSVLSWKEVF